VAWKIKISEFAEKQIKKLDKSIAKQIILYLKERIATQKDPRILGKSLLHDKSGLWRYRVNHYRIICKIEAKELIVLVLRLGHRKDIYKK
jgi:mRNA interferase RelE/StbE